MKKLILCCSFLSFLLMMSTGLLAQNAYKYNHNKVENSDSMEKSSELKERESVKKDVQSVELLKQVEAVEKSDKQSQNVPSSATPVLEKKSEVNNIAAQAVVKEPTVNYTIIEATAPRVSEAKLANDVNVEKLNVSSFKKSLEDYTDEELLNAYQIAAPATKTKILANPILKERLNSLGVD